MMKLLVAVIATAAVATGCSSGGSEKPVKATVTTSMAPSPAAASEPTYTTQDWAEAANFCQAALNARHAGRRMAVYPVAEWQACLTEAISAPGHGWGS